MPTANPAGYSGTPLPKKLGIKPATVTVVVDPPEGFAATLGELPEGARLVAGGSPEGSEDGDLVVWFVRHRAALAPAFARLAAAPGAVPVWLCWPKKTSSLAADFGENEVRAAGLAAGLVDFKVCAVDADWSGLKFIRRERETRRVRPA